MLFEHEWQPFVGNGAPGSHGSNTKGVTLPRGNYEWPFELMLPGRTAESIEGLREAHITYKLKATVARGKLAYDIHAYKRLRVIRTLEPSALEFLHAMSVENIWVNKIEYSIVVPQKAVVFGTSIPLETRFSPLLKGLELGDITIRLIEVHHFILSSAAGQPLREYRRDREVSLWKIPMSRDEHWRDMIDDTGQEGWVMNTSLDLPRKLTMCLQDTNVHGIKIRHKLKVVVALKNPDGHVSELRAALPVTIFISPNMPLDEEGNLVRQLPQGAAAQEITTIAPPSYNEHVLDQLYEDIESTGLQTPATQSGISSPAYGHSRSGSAENLSALNNLAITPAALSSRLQRMFIDQSARNTSLNSMTVSGSSVASQFGVTTIHGMVDTATSSAPSSAPLTRQNSDERSSGRESPEQLDLSEMCRVPSYQTARNTPARAIVNAPGFLPPNYQTAVNRRPASPEATEIADPMTTAAASTVLSASSSPFSRRSVIARRRRNFSINLSLPHGWHHGDAAEHRRLHILQSRERVA